MGKKKILIVDDQPGIRLLLSEVFLQESFSVHLADTGKQALEKVDKHSFDIILLDYRLPSFDGLQVIEKLKQKNFNVPIIFMSGLIENMPEELERFPAIKKIIKKPFDIQQLVNDVHKILAS